MDDETVRVIHGTLGTPEKTTTLGPGETLDLANDGPSYVRIEVADVVAAGSTTEQEENRSDDDREWAVDAIQCQGCGQRYPQDHTRCPECGNPNPSET